MIGASEWLDLSSQRGFGSRGMTFRDFVVVLTGDAQEREEFLLVRWLCRDERLSGEVSRSADGFAW